MTPYNQLHLNRAAHTTLILVLGVFVSTLIFWPYLSSINSALPNSQDSILSAWIVASTGSSLISGNPLTLPFLYPIHNSLTFSAPFLVSSLLTVPVLPFLSSVIPLHTFLLVIYSLCHFLGMYWASGEVLKTSSSRLAAATVFAFAPLHLQYVSHIHAFNLVFYPLILWGLIKLSKTKQSHYFALVVSATVLQSLEDPHHAIFLSLLVAVFLLLHWRLALKMWQAVIVYAACAGLFLIAIYYPWLQTSLEYAYVRSIRDAAHFSLNLADLGKLPVFSLLVGSILSLAFIKEKRSKFTVFLIIVTLVGIVLALGPVVKNNQETLRVAGFPIPLPYAGLYYTYPGFQIIRASDRFVLYLLFSASLLIALAIDAMTRIKRVCITIGVFVLVLGFAPHYTPVVHLPKTPDYVTVLIDLPQGPVAEFPVLNWNMTPYAELEHQRLAWQYEHKHPLYNGVTGFMPPERVELWHTLWQHLDTQTIEYLKENGVSYLVVNSALYEELWREQYTYGTYSAPNPDVLYSELKQSPITLLWEDTTHSIYALD